MKKMGLLILIFSLVSVSRAALFSGDETVESVQVKIDSLPPTGHSTKKGKLYAELGRLLYRQGHMTEAAQTYEKSLTFSTSRSLRKHIYLYMGKSYESSSRLDRALEAYVQAVRYDKKNWRRHRDIAQIYEQVVLYPEAVNSYLSAIKYNPKSSTVFLSLGRTYRKMGLYRQAEEALKKSHDLDNDSSALYSEFSRIFEGSGRFMEAAQNQRRVVSPSSPVPEWGRLVYLAAVAGDKRMANEGLSQIRKMETLPDTVLFYEELVDLLGRKPETRLSASLTDPTLRALIGAVRVPAAQQP